MRVRLEDSTSERKNKKGRDAAAKKVRFMDYPACLRPSVRAFIAPRAAGHQLSAPMGGREGGREGGGLPVPLHGREKQALLRLRVAAAAAALAPNRPRPSSSLRRSITSSDSHSYPSLLLLFLLLPLFLNHRHQHNAIQSSPQSQPWPRLGKQNLK